MKKRKVKIGLAAEPTSQIEPPNFRNIENNQTAQAYLKRRIKEHAKPEQLFEEVYEAQQYWGNVLTALRERLEIKTETPKTAKKPASPSLRSDYSDYYDELARSCTQEVMNWLKEHFPEFK